MKIHMKKLFISVCIMSKMGAELYVPCVLLPVLLSHVSDTNILYQKSEQEAGTLKSHPSIFHRPGVVLQDTGSLLLQERSFFFIVHHHITNQAMNYYCVLKIGVQGSTKRTTFKSLLSQDYTHTKSLTNISLIFLPRPQPSVSTNFYRTS